MSSTVHFIDSDRILQSYCLDTLPLFEDHTGENIAEALKDILENWSLCPNLLLLQQIMGLIILQSWVDPCKLLWLQPEFGC